MTRQYKRIVVKIGSAVLTRDDGTLNVTRMSALVDQVAELRKNGIEVILVSSGAVACGRGELGGTAPRKTDSVGRRQLFSAVGQAKLVNRYYELFREHHLPVGQVLTMKENFGTRRHYLNQRNCMAVMLENGVIPIVNENDAVSVTELMFTDNDELSGLVATMMDVQALVILTDVDGIYDGLPGEPGAEVIREVEPGRDLREHIRAGKCGARREESRACTGFSEPPPASGEAKCGARREESRACPGLSEPPPASGEAKSGFGRGGMTTKYSVARKVADEGIEVFIANGKRENVLTDLILRPENGVCTRFIPREGNMSGVKRWVAHSGGFTKGKIHLNAKAAEAVCGDGAASILPVGVTHVEGDFEKGDLVCVVSPDGRNIGVGRAAYGYAEACRVMGRHDCKPLVHYDYLYLEQETWT